MAFTKISKEEWLKLSKSEQEHLNLEFNKSVEDRKRLTIIATRSIALILCLSLFYIGYVQLEQAKGFSQVMEKRGNIGYCELCGSEALRRCECVYNYDGLKDTNQLSKELAEYNIQVCKPKELVSNFTFDPNKPLNISFIR
jgi:hypothetical protein